MGSSFLYSAFGLTLESSLPLPGLRHGSGRSDVAVSFAAVPENANAGRDGEFGYEGTGKSVLIHVGGIATFSVENGDRVIVQTSLDREDPRIWGCMLGCAIVALLHQRSVVPFHASAIQTDKGCVMFMGASGLGKSTLAAGFRARGRRVVSNDICGLVPGIHQAPMVVPGHPHVRLTSESLSKLGLHLPLEGISQKARVPVGDDFCDTPLPLWRAYLLSTHAADNIRITTLSSMESCTALIRHTCFKGLLSHPDGRCIHLKCCASAAQSVPLKKIARPETPFSLEQLLDELEFDFLTDA